VYLPEAVLTNEDLEKMVDTTSQWIVERSGIHERRIAAPDEDTVTMAVAAGRQALEASGVEPEQLSYIVLGTNTPPHFFPAGASRVSDLVSVVRENGQWTYFCGVQPVFCHPEADRRSFRMFTAQLVCRGACRQVDIVRTFGVSKNSVKRSVKRYHEGGVEAFYVARKKRGATVLTTTVTAEAQRLLDSGRSRHEVAERLGVKCDTLRKAIQQGRCRLSAVECPLASDRPAAARMPRPRWVRLASADGLNTLGMLEGATPFEPCRTFLRRCAAVRLGMRTTVAASGSLPTLQATTRAHIRLLLAYLALCRIKTVERLQYEPPGELGKLLGLDRVPEVRCLRKKLATLAGGNAAEKWAALLSRDWMETAPELAGTLYVDGHVRLYHGHQTELPRRYVARQRLCLRGTTDYWSTTPWGNRFSPSNGRSTTACWRPCGATWCRVYCATFLASRAKSNSTKTPIGRGSC
jgi:transposase